MRPLRRRPLAPRWGRLGPGARQAVLKLQEAHALMAQGAWTQAAAIFEELAGAAEARGLPRASQLFLQAGRTRIEAGEIEVGVQNLRHGLTLMDRMGQLRRLPIAAARVISELRARGLVEQAASLEAEMGVALARHGLSLAAFPPKVERRLPAKCPQCGGTVHPDEVEWIDEHSAACDYCGSVIQTDEHG